MEENNILDYEVVGEGTPVLLLHGFLESRLMWQNIVPKLEGYKIILVDLPGHGKSKGFPKDSWQLSDFAHAVATVLEKERVTSVQIVGHSLGGYVALEWLALQTEITCNQLILLNSHPWEDSPSKKKERTRVATIVAKNKNLFLSVAIPNLYLEEETFQAEITTLIEEASQMDASAIVKTIIAMRDRNNYVATIKTHAKNSAVIQGERDRLIDAKAMSDFCTVHNIRFTCFSNVGHMAHQEAEEQVVACFKEWLK